MENILLLVILISWSSSATALPTLDVSTIEGQQKWLEQYNYLGPLSVVPGMASLSQGDAFTKAVKYLQRFLSLPETGVVDEETMKYMDKERCGQPDVTHMSIFTRRKKRFVLQGSAWTPGSTLTWRINVYSQKLSNQLQDDIFNAAFSFWSRAGNIKFQQVKSTSSTVDIDIMFTRGSHGDYEPFDGSGGILAHAFFPSFGGDEHFDEDESWSHGSFYGINLLQTVTHEIGHTLGLSHSNVQDSIMWPYIRPYDPNFALTNDDVQGIQRIYGKASNYPSQTPAPTPGPTMQPKTNAPAPVTASPKPGPFDPYDNCNIASIDAVTLTQDGSTYIFRGDYVYKIGGLGVEAGYPVRISDNERGFSPITGKIDAALYWENTRETYLFKEYYVAVFQNREFKRYMYINDVLRGAPSNVDSVFYWPRNGKTYITKGDQYWRYDSAMGSAQDSGYPQPMSRWSLPGGVDAAFQYSNERTYFFKGSEYYRFDDANIKTENGYPRPTNYWWFGCRSNSLNSGVQPESSNNQQITIVSPVNNNDDDKVSGFDKVSKTDTAGGAAVASISISWIFVTILTCIFMKL